MVFGIIDKISRPCGRAFIGEIAIGIIAPCDRRYRRILIEAIISAVIGDLIDFLIIIGPAGRGLAGDLRRRAIGKTIGDIIGSRGQVIGQRRQTTQGVIAV